MIYGLLEYITDYTYMYTCTNVSKYDDHGLESKWFWRPAAKCHELYQVSILGSSFFSLFFLLFFFLCGGGGVLDNVSIKQICHNSNNSILVRFVTSLLCSSTLFIFCILTQIPWIFSASYIVESWRFSLMVTNPSQYNKVGQASTCKSSTVLIMKTALVMFTHQAVSCEFSLCVFMLKP